MRAIWMVAVIICRLIHSSSTEEVGDACLVAGSGAAGTCQLPEHANCPPIPRDVVANMRYMANKCEVRTHTLILCCPNPTTTTTKKPFIAHRISQRSVYIIKLVKNKYLILI